MYRITNNYKKMTIEEAWATVAEEAERGLEVLTGRDLRALEKALGMVEDVILEKITNR